MTKDEKIIKKKDKKEMKRSPKKILFKLKFLF